jgi:spoIIIJ-associated protein
MEERTQFVKQVLRELLDHMGINAEIETEVSEETLVFNLRTPDSGILIGQHGTSLGALQYLARALVHKKMPEAVHFVLDVEGYKKSREEFLRELARQAAARVRETKEALLLKPMAAYERRVVHAEISKLPDIATESTGEEPERRVLIKLKN